MSNQRDQGDHQQPPEPKLGHCNRCGRVWTLEHQQGVCKWCGKSASCQTSQTKRLATTSRRPEPPRRTLGQGFDQLPEPYLTFYNVALPFARGIPAQDSEDLLHTIILTLARANGHKPLSEAAMYRIASITKANYWREHYKHTNGLDCGHCSNQQRKQCRKDWLYGNCPKAIKIEDLHKPIIDSEGNITELGDLIADDKALDLDAWLERNEQILHSPDRLLAIAGKIQDGDTLTHAERTYLCKARKRLQKTLF